MTDQSSTRQLPHGPDEPVVLDVNEESFIRIGEMCAEYGDIFQLKSPSRSTPTIAINHPDYIKRVLVTNYKNYIKGIGFERVKMLLGNGIIVSDGEHWRTQRRMISPSAKRSLRTLPR